MNLSGLTRPTTLIVLVVVLVLLFGAKRLPDAARSLGRSLRIMKAETRGLVEDGKSEDLDEKADAQAGREPLPRQTGSGPRDRDGRRDRDDRDRDDRDSSARGGYDRGGSDYDGSDHDGSDYDGSDHDSYGRRPAPEEAVAGEVVDPPQRARER